MFQALLNQIAVRAACESGVEKPERSALHERLGSINSGEIWRR